MKNRIYNLIKKYNLIYVFVIILLLIIKQALMKNFPIVALVGAGEDDALMVKLAKSILDGNWLGEYRYNILMKGPVFPIILALICKLNLSYITIMTFFYSISCLIFLLSIRTNIDNKKFLVILFAILVFNPIMYSINGIQRVYRNAIVPPFSLLIFSSYISIFVRKDKKINFIWFVILIIILPLFYFTREDSIWIMPYIIFMSICIIIDRLIIYKKISFKLFSVILGLILPILAINLFGTGIAKINEKYYGIKVINIQSKTNFASALEAIYMVKPNVAIDCVNVPLEKIDRMAEVSESFKLIVPELKTAIAGYNQFDRNSEDGEVEDGWFSWALMTAVVNTGFTEFAQQQDMYARICNELHSQMASGNLEIQKIGPIAKTSVWRANYINHFIDSVCKTIKYVITMEDVKIDHTKVSVKSKDQIDTAKLFENITHDKCIYSNNIIELQSDIDLQNTYINSINIQSFILNGFINIYRVLNIIISIFGIISYIILTILIIKKLRVREYNLIKNWIIVSGLLGAFVTLIFGVAYTNTTMVYAINSLYLCTSYPIIMLFGMLTIYYLVKELKSHEYFTKVSELFKN